MTCCQQRPAAQSWCGLEESRTWSCTSCLLVNQMGVEVDWMMAEPEGGSSSDRSQHSDDASGQSPQASDSQASGSPSGQDVGSEQSSSPGEGPSQQSSDDGLFVSSKV
ncbi:Hypp4632 [Branchiostoma lanceolatum]|uniref:Hypp4632 protein n=1 Tax=Branchiostoma lanceolatum TaxID=7740 RepID=A0A8K0A8M7_BRALA|nr:Hypp4632 [Branchiostoma lanceolatum]